MSEGESPPLNRVLNVWGGPNQGAEMVQIKLPNSDKVAKEV